MVVDISFLMMKILIILIFLNPVACLFPSYIQILIFALWFVGMIGSRKQIGECFTFSAISALIFISTLFRCIIAERTDLTYFSPMQAAIARYQVFSLSSLFPYVIRLDSIKKKKIFDMAIICITATVILSLYYIFFVDPQAVRNTQGVYYFGVGDFQLMYGIAVLGGPFLAYIFKRKRQGDSWLLYLLSFILMSICVLLCNLVTSVVILAISIVVTWFLCTKQRVTKFVLVIMMLLVVLLKDLWVTLLRFVADKNIFYWSTNNKIYAIANLLSGSKENLDTLSSRSRLMISINTFKDNPILGVNFKNHVEGVIGEHAQWIDDLARFGILGNIIIWGSYFYLSYSCIKRCEKNETKKWVAASWIVAFILGFLNPTLSGPILAVLFIVIPCLDHYSQKGVGKIYEGSRY